MNRIYDNSFRGLDLRVLFFCLAISVFGVGPVLADRSIRCDGRLVSIGAFKEQVSQKCGEPDHITQWEEGPNAVISQLFDYETERYLAPRLIFGPIHMERWTYDFGSNRLIHYLYFQNGKLIKIETGERGSR